MSNQTHKDDHRIMPLPPAPPFSVWQIMGSSVNDNSPGYLYWFTRIAIASSLSFFLIILCYTILF